MLSPRLLALSLLFLAACTATEPVTAPPPPPPTAQGPTVVTQPEPEPEPDPLYEETEDDLRQAFTDGLFGLYRAEVNTTDARRLNRSGVEAWLSDLARSSPEAVAFARTTLGPALDEPYLVGFVLPGAAVAECASQRDVLYISVPARHQGPDRPFAGYIVQDVCDVPSGELGLFCTGGFGTTDDGSACSCTCTTGEAPGVGCVSCGGD